MKRLVKFAIPLLFVLVFAACSSAQPAAARPAAQPVSQAAQAVSISNFAFNPSSLTVPVGTTVTWTNNDSVTHTVTADNQGFNSGMLNPGQTFSFTFNQAGSFSYKCTIHPMMTGTIVVTQ